MNLEVGSHLHDTIRSRVSRTCDNISGGILAYTTFANKSIFRLSLVLVVLPALSLAQEKNHHEDEQAQKRVFLPQARCDFPDDSSHEGNGCLSCHEGIEPIRCANSGMFRMIESTAEKAGSSSRCVVCHGGNPDIVLQHGHFEPDNASHMALVKKAHEGTIDYFKTHDGPKSFYPDPGSPWINDNSCAACHPWHVKAQWSSLMMTEAGKIQGTAWSFGGMTGYDHRWANYPVDDGGRKNWVGSDRYKQYMQELSAKYGNVFKEHMDQVPDAPKNSEELSDPARAAFTYIRGECERCHLGVGGVQRYGDYRGLGCSACHMPYANSGMSISKDPTVDRTSPGHPLVHMMQSGFDAPLVAGKIHWSGIPVDTCTTCHNRGRRIGVSFQGLMESPYQSPWTDDAGKAPAIHGKHYLHLKADLHHDKGFMCQDCHTSLDVHGANMLIGSVSGAVEIECFDCHGTPDRYPWELPLGFGDEYAMKPKQGPARGTASRLPDYMQDGRTPAVEDGYLLSSRGNPLGNAVRSGNKVKLYLASGEVKTLNPLKGMNEQGTLSARGRISMVQVRGHMEKLECYACHAAWAPQCYGCHVKVDYSAKSKKHYDWLAVGMAHGANGLTTEYTPEAEAFKLDGEISESRSYLRWEDPALAVDGEGRVSPVVPGCQTSVTVVDKTGKVRLLNHIFRIPNVEGAGEKGQRAIDMAPLHPHTVQAHARDCVSCHTNPKALGYGIAGGKLWADSSKPTTVDLMTGDGKLISPDSKPLLSQIPSLAGDWSRFVTEDGKQTQTVGHHFPLSGPLTAEQRSHMDRETVCLSCHKEIPDRSSAVVALHHVAETLGMMPRTSQEHEGLLNKTLLLAGWVQVLGVSSLPLLFLLVIFCWRRIKKKNT